MDKQSSSIKGRVDNDSKSTQNDFNSKTTSNYNSFEFLDMSSCDETQKLKLKNTLNSPSSSSAAFSTQRERYRSNFATRNSSIKSTPQQYATIQYHANNTSKSQKPNYQFYQTKHPNSIEHHVSISSRSFSSEANNFSSKNNSNFNNISTTLSNTPNISSKRLDDNRHYPNTQEKLSKWHSNNKKPPYVGLKDSTQVNQKETPVRRTSGVKEPIHYHQKELSRDLNKNFTNRVMSPPLTNFQTNTTLTTTSSSPSSSVAMSNQSNVTLPHQVHMSQSTTHYSSNSQQMFQQMYPSGSVPLIHYPIHTGYMTNAPPPGQLIPSHYGGHESRDNNIGMQLQNDHQSNSSSQHPINSTRGSRRGRSRGGNNNNMSRREYNMRQGNLHQHQQQNQHSSLTSNEYGQPLLEQPQQTAVMGSGSYQQQFYIHHYPPYYGPGPNAGAQHLAANAATAQNLTGQPLFAIQQPLQVFQYGSPYPIMYNMMPTQAHHMSHQQNDIPENEHSQNQESSGTAPTTVLQPIPWPHVAYQDPHQQPLYQHSPHINAGEVDMEFTHPDEYQMQMMNPSSNFTLITPDQLAGNIVNDNVQLDQDAYVDTASIDGEAAVDQQQQMYQLVGTSDTRLLIEKTRDLMIQTDGPPPSHPIKIQDTNEEYNNSMVNDANVPNQDGLKMSPTHSGAIENSVATEVVENMPITKAKVVCSVDNKMIVKNKEKPPAWGSVVVPNLATQTSVKKQTASVSVSAIPNKDSVQFQNVPNVSDSTSSLHDQKKKGVQEVNSTISNSNEFPTSDKTNHFINNQKSFSLITASKQLLPPATDGKKTENIQTDTQPLQKQHQMALSERAKQQIVTTITGVGSSSQESVKKLEVPSPKKQSTEDVSVAVEKSVPAPKSSPVVNPSAPSRATWAGLFNASDPGSVSKASPPLSIQTAASANQTLETQKASTAKNPDPLFIQTTQVPGVMSYSAVSAQSLPAVNPNYAATVTSIPPQMSNNVSDGKKLPQSKLNLPNNNNHLKSAPVIDQHALKLGDFFSKYKIESNSVSLLPRGLLNKSNYCYINATLQALVACPPFYHLMRAIPQLPLSYRVQTKTPVTDAMVELVSNYSQLPYRKWAPREKSKKDDVPEISRDSAFEPTVILKMLQALRTEMFPVEGRQEDAEEFLSFILNRMNDEMIELKKLVEKPKPPPKKEENGEEVNGNVDPSNDDDEEWQVISGTRNKSTITRTTDFGRSPISDIFGGKLRLRVHREGDHSSDNIEPFFTLKLVIEKASSVREALEILVGRDQLEGVTCSKGVEVAAWQQVTLEELPVVLILHLKCFDFKKESCTKILKTVEFPVELKIDPKIMASKNKYQQKQKQYKLFAVVYHDGKEVSKGHYITDVFHVGYSSWIRYDDSTVKAVPESNVLHPKSPRVPYLLYYRRYDTIGGGATREQRDHNCNNQSNQKSTK